MLAPAILLHIDAVILRSLLDVGESELAVGVGDALDLVEAGKGVLDMARVGQRLFCAAAERQTRFPAARPDCELSRIRCFQVACAAIAISSMIGFGTFPGSLVPQSEISASA